MSAYSNFQVTCHQDQSLAVLTACVLENLAESFETFHDKPQIDAIKDVHSALLEWEEVQESHDPSVDMEFFATITTENQSWVVDFSNAQWILDLRMSVFHGRLIFKLNTDA